MKNLMSKLKILGCIPLTLTVLALSVTTSFYAGDLKIDKFNFSWFSGIGTILILFLLTTLLVDLVDSMLKVKHFINPETKQVDIVSLWHGTYTNPLAGIVIAFIMTIGVANAQDLSEVYRTSVSHWHDAELWLLEYEYLSVIKKVLFDYPNFWDTVYFLTWGYLMLVYSILYKTKRFYHFGVLSISTVLSFFITRWSAIKYPTAGPVFYQPEFFNISGTVSSNVQEMLLLYMNGYIPQNGFIPGTMGMPSLHVGLTVMATWFLSCHARWTLWLTVPLTCLIWLSTITLGWHYILDGLGGVGVAAVSITFAYAIIQVIGSKVSSTIKVGDEEPVRDSV